MKKQILIFLIITLAACQETTVFEKYQALENEEWCLNNDITFDVGITRAAPYKINLCLRHTIDYEMANLWCFLSVRDSTGEILRDSINIKVAEPDGRWLGTGSSIRTVEFPINQKTVSLTPGKYTFRIEQGMRTKCLKGIKDIGLKIQ